MYLIYDTETMVDPDRLVRVEALNRPGVVGTREELIAKKLDDICKDKGKEAGCFIPVTYHAPVCAVMLLVDDQLNYRAHRVIANTKDGKPDFARNTVEFWDLYNSAKKDGPLTLVDFNGHCFDSPLMEMAGIEYGADLSQWLMLDAKGWDDPRSRFYFKPRLDLYQFLVGRTGNKYGDLNFWSRLCGLPGKLDTTGDNVAELLKAQNGLERVTTYCVADVANTYGLLFQVLYAMRMIPTNWRCPAFHATIEKLMVGQGAEMQTLQRFCLSDGPLF